MRELIYQFSCPSCPVSYWDVPPALLASNKACSAWNSCTKTDRICTTAVFSRKNDTGIKSGRKWGMQTSGRSLPEGSALVIEVVPTTGASFGLRLQFLSGWDFLWQSVQRRQTESRVSFLRNVRATGSSWILHLFDKSMFHISHSEFLNNLSAL